MCQSKGLAALIRKRTRPPLKSANGASERHRQNRRTPTHVLPEKPAGCPQIRAVKRCPACHATHNAFLETGTDGTATRFRRASLDQFRIIHLAVHGIANPDYPDRAALVFKPDPPADDGLFDLDQVLGLRLNADLVVLSSCGTAVGRLQGEEGIANLSRAFLSAGAKSVISTLWRIDDSYSVFLIKRLYSHLRAGDEEAVALARSQTDLLTTFGANTAPAYWAAFTLLGTGDAALFDENSGEVRAQ
jgi:CHAT domain-containing protein